jgi:hypothetical protein
MVFPEGAAIESPALASNMAILRWYLDENRIEGERQVESMIKPRVSEEHPKKND